MAHMAPFQRSTSAMGHIDSELLAEGDEPPERKEHLPHDSPRLDAAFFKSLPPAFTRRESLLTRQLHSPEPEYSHEDEHQRARAIVRGMSAWSNHSIASTAELTSDNDLTSPGTRESTPSPPLPPTLIRDSIPTLEKSPYKEPVILEDSKPQPEKSVEAELGRPRCITFACGGRKPASNHVTSESEQEKKPAPAVAPTEPPKRKTCITFACPSKPAVQTAPIQEKTKATTLAPTQGPKTRIVSPGPRISKTQASPKHFPRNHRGSDSTVKNDSPKSLRKGPSLPVRRRKYSMENDDVPGEERRFHEFGPSEEENEQWLEESGCYRQRLTVNDTLYKENIIRQIGEEVEEEAIEDDEDDEEIEEDEDEDEDDEDLEDLDIQGAVSDEEVSDAGFQTDDEDGFAVSDSEGDDSENEWWAPGGRSTAATSMEHLEHARPTRRRTNSDSSLGSAHGENTTASAPYGMVKRRSRALKINRPQTPDLPDSTDFVCGTLDEDRPLEQAYIMSLERRKAAKHKAKPQDIDPTFPTSDPDMDEEDDDDEDEDVEESDHPLFMHGKIEMNEDTGYRGRRKSKTAIKKKSISPPHQRLRSPPPPKHRSHRSPPPSAKRLRSPAPIKRSNRKSPPPRKLFGQSPRRMRSPPPPPRRPTSPPPSLRSSVEGVSAISFTPRATLARRPQPTHTASLPRVESQVKIGANAMTPSLDEHDDPLSARGAIDIVKGLEKKRQRRKEKLYQKHCQKGKKDQERKPKPGKGAERMREVGLELAAYKGKKQHVLSY
ncbi:hypothetical protein E4T52_12116 [Aureobasidium sp. EXF-3400]|nr:hypothetical protein E4T51_11143 [Aureobasidium sp. EXF-12344]KAI4772911.1 hypothetical protein E4T52_12116 [Aureobasidium sp. EXF-3400]